MRNIAILILLIGYFSSAFGQTFKGTVYDRSNDSALSFATVYISGTSVGTVSDIHGNFELDISKFSFMPITISLLGYNSVTLFEHNCNKAYHIYLSTKINEINEVVITAPGDIDRVSKLKVFKKEFLGETQNGLHCEILNENDIYLVYSNESGALKAFSSKPILIHNKALGYTITYYLDKFIYLNSTKEKGDLIRVRNSYESITIKGNYIFKDDLLNLSDPEKRKIERNRRNTYLGSRMHFFRLLYKIPPLQDGKHNIVLSDNTPFFETFSISSKSTINSNSLVIQKDSIYGYLKNQGDLSIRYRSMNTRIKIISDSVYFEKNGYYDPDGLEFSGEMSIQRIGDLLPFEYMIK